MRLVAVCLLLACAWTSPRAQTYEASSYERPDLGPRHAFDGDPGTRWSAAFKAKTGWIQVRFDEPRKFTRVTVVSGVRDLRGAPKDFDVLAGEDGALRVVAAVTGNTADRRTVAFDETTASIWRIEIKSRINDRWSPTLSEITFAGGDVATGESAEARPRVEASDPGKPGHEPERAMDGDRYSRYEARSKDGEVWVQLTYPRPMTFDAMRMHIWAEGGYGVPQELSLMVKSGRRWKTIGSLERSFTNTPTLRFPPTRARVWRIVVEKLIDPRGSFRVSEIEMTLLGEATWPRDPEPVVEVRAVNRAIDRAVAWLLRRRRADGTWTTPHTEEYPMGVMALAGLALLKSGMPRDEVVLADVARRLEAMPLRKTYSVGLYATFLAAHGPRTHRDRIAACAAWLVEHQGPDGLWGYPDGRTDLSNAQFALLGLKAATECGADVPRRVFEKSLDWLLRSAQDDGGFNYVPHGKRARDPSTGSMTVAALASLKICGDRARPRGRKRAIERTVSRAMAWLADRFVVEMNPGAGQSHYYYLYGVERIGAFFETRKIGRWSWYPLGARHLIGRQQRDGSWHGRVTDTCFALLFLERASITRAFDDGK